MIPSTKPLLVVEAFAASWIEILLLPIPNHHHAVEAFAASWIEIAINEAAAYYSEVEAFAASWIEIITAQVIKHIKDVEAFAASWIEIITGSPIPDGTLSKPLRLRGLKSFSSAPTLKTPCRSLCGFVD